jgi:hypothetical protein
MSAPVSAEARGRLRKLLADLQREADAIKRAVHALPLATVAASQQKATVGARHAYANIARKIPADLVWHGPREAAWRFLAPDVHGVGVMVVLLGAPGRPKICVETFGLSFTRHSLGRLLDRSGFSADPAVAMREAHDGLMALAPADGERVFALPELVLPGARGCFLAVPQMRNSTGSPMATCWTWLDRDQTFPDQARDLEAWREVLATPAS